MGKRYQKIEDLDFFKDLESLVDEIWEEVMTWQTFSRDTIGKQLVEAADSSGSNLVEGDSRYSYKESIHFFYIARGSATEARYWIKRAQKRGLISKEKSDSFIVRFDDIIPKINSIIGIRRKWLNQFGEEQIGYLKSYDKIIHNEGIEE